MKANLKLSLAALIAVLMCTGMVSGQAAEGGERPQGEAERPERGEADRPRGERPREGEARGERRERGERGSRGGERGERGDRGDRGDRSERGERGERADPLFKDIELSDEQKGKIKEVRDASREEMRAIRAEMREAREGGDREAMKSAAEKLRAFNEKTQAQVREVLTEEQHEQFDKNIAAIKERGQRRGGAREGAEGERRGGEGAQSERPRGQRGERAEGERPRGDGAEGERPRRPRGEGDGERRPRGGDRESTREAGEGTNP